MTAKALLTSGKACQTKSVTTIVRNTFGIVNGYCATRTFLRTQLFFRYLNSTIKQVIVTQPALFNFVPHSAQKRAVASTGTEHFGQKRSGTGIFVPQS